MWPETVRSWRIGKEPSEIPLLNLQIIELRRQLNYPYLVFRGFDNPFILSDALADGPIINANPLADFSHGQYYTPSIMYARLYARQGGVITVHDFSGQGGTLSKRTLDGQEWTTMVKYQIGKNNELLPRLPFPPDYTEDFLLGKVSTDHQSIFVCYAPIPSQIDQIVAKTPQACNYMASHLIGIVYVT
jgi:hypothetical protein